jgi:hypothetical protein
MEHQSFLKGVLDTTRGGASPCTHLSDPPVAVYYTQLHQITMKVEFRCMASNLEDNLKRTTHAVLIMNIDKI